MIPSTSKKRGTSIRLFAGYWGDANPDHARRCLQFHKLGFLELGGLTAAATVVTLPVLITSLIVQRYIFKGPHYGRPERLMHPIPWRSQPAGDRDTPLGSGHPGGALHTLPPNGQGQVPADGDPVRAGGVPTLAGFWRRRKRAADRHGRAGILQAGGPDRRVGTPGECPGEEPRKGQRGEIAWVGDLPRVKRSMRCADWLSVGPRRRCGPCLPPGAGVATSGSVGPFVGLAACGATSSRGRPPPQPSFGLPAADRVTGPADMRGTSRQHPGGSGS